LRVGVCIVVLVSVLLGARTGGAQSVDLGAKPAEKPLSRGFQWFFTNVKRPDVPCAGELVVATWYSSGKRTANGQAFNPEGLTAAHRTLPFGSRLRVINPQSGKAVTVVINDRGPFVKGVTLDLARGAARAIGMHSTQWVCMSPSPHESLALGARTD
jgi:rare lipoprotein A